MVYEQRSLKLGMVGLGRMGGGMSARLKQAGLDVVGYDLDPSESDVASIADLVAAIDPPRVVWFMVPAGEPTSSAIEEASKSMEPGDVIVDGGNSRYTESIARAASLSSRRIGFIDAGVSGGIWGPTEGYCLMVGGEKEHVDALMPIFQALAPEGGFVHAGPQGAGHFTKMVHNGIEYALMHAFGEGFELLERSELGIDVNGTLAAWRKGSVVRSWLLELLVKALDEDEGLHTIAGWAEDSGEGRWTVEEAIRLGVPLNVISSALFARFSSRQDSSSAMKVVAALRNQFGGHVVNKLEA